MAGLKRRVPGINNLDRHRGTDTDPFPQCSFISILFSVFGLISPQVSQSSDKCENVTARYQLRNLSR